jgi:hypothetical protein
MEMKMANNKKKTSTSGTSKARAEMENTDMLKTTKKPVEFQDPKVSFLPVIKVSRWTFDMLCKVQAASGIPLEIWGESELIKAIYREWDFIENRLWRDVNHE